MNKTSIQNAILKILTEKDYQKQEERLYKITCSITDSVAAGIINKRLAKKYAKLIITLTKQDCGWGHFSNILPHSDLTELMANGA